MEKTWFGKAKPLDKIPAHNLELFKNRVSALAPDDPLWPMLVALVRSNLDIEISGLARAGVSDGEAHRARGRVGMLLDLEQQLDQVWRESHR